MKRTIQIIVGVLAIGVLLGACKKEAPSIAKIYVRSASNELMVASRVVIIADALINESPVSYVDTLYTNSSGFAEFNLDGYYSQVEKSVKTAVFDIICNSEENEGTGTMRTRIHTTAVQTIKLQN